MQTINNTNIQQAIKQIKNSKEKIIIVQAQSDIFNRKLLEHGKFNVLLSPEKDNHKHTIRQLDSGLNHVLAKIASRNNVSIGINFDDLSKLSKEKKAIRLSKIRQNIKICRKAKANLAIINEKDKKSASHLLLSLGASTLQTKVAVSF